MDATNSQNIYCHPPATWLSTIFLLHCYRLLSINIFKVLIILLFSKAKYRPVKLRKRH